MIYDCEKYNLLEEALGIVREIEKSGCLFSMEIKKAAIDADVGILKL
jgi:hypothetical protein